MKSILTTILVVFGSLLSYGQALSYAVASLPAGLKDSAHVIKRYEEIKFEVTDIDRASYTVHQVFTVMDKEGDAALTFYTHTNRQVSLEDVEIKSYDPLGNLTNKYKRKDLQKQGSMGGLVEDGMYHYLTLGSSGYPITVEYRYKLNFSGTLIYPRYILALPGQAVEYSSYTAKTPAELGLRYKEQKIQLQPVISEAGAYKVYKWEVKNRPAYKAEEGATAPEFSYPAILFAPNKFRHFNTYGELSSWKSFGAWAYSLLNGLDALSPEREVFFQNLVKDASTEREKVALIYGYLQKNFRYVSIQLGIGGVKPFPAKFTDEKKYGDCKGLSFYMLAALKAVGIKSHMAFINAEHNQEPVDPSFPCDRFNHAILCVPVAKDSIWLECTSNTSEFGILGTFTENRNALLLTENGGVLVNTPISRSSHNVLNSVTNITLLEDGSGQSHTTLQARGEYKEALTQVQLAKKDEQKIFIVNYLGFKQPDEFILTNKSGVSLCETQIKLAIEKIPQFSAGNKMFLSPRISSLWATVLPNAEGRQQDYYFRFPLEKTDSTTYHLPEGYAVDVLPKGKTSECAYAKYSTSYQFNVDKNEVISIGTLTLKTHKIPAAGYAEAKKFFDAVVSDASQKIVIKKG